MRILESVTSMDKRIERYRDELRGVLTIPQCAKVFEISPRTVRKHVEEGILFAEKQDETEYNPRSGFWLIPFSAASDLYGKKSEIQYVRNGTISSSGVK